MQGNKKNLLRWSGEKDLEMYQSWCLEPSEVSTANIWAKWEEFCKPQDNKLRA